MTLKEAARKMAKLDICMLTTTSSRGLLTSRPMSNNGDVNYDGNSYFFTMEETHAIKDIEANAQVNLSFAASNDLYISVAGKAKLIRSRAKMEPHWNKDIEKWFEEGIDTPGLVMIHVKASRIKYWQREQEGEVKLKE